MEILWKDRKRTLFGLPLSFTKYVLTEEKLLITTGALSTKEEEIRLYRILDFTIHKSLFNRLFNVGTIEIHTADRSTPVYTLVGVKNPNVVKDMMSEKVEEERRKKNVTTREFFSDDPDRAI